MIIMSWDVHRVDRRVVMTEKSKAELLLDIEKRDKIIAEQSDLINKMKDQLNGWAEQNGALLRIAVEQQGINESQHNINILQRDQLREFERSLCLVFHRSTDRFPEHMRDVVVLECGTSFGIDVGSLFFSKFVYSQVREYEDGTEDCVCYDPNSPVEAGYTLVCQHEENLGDSFSVDNPPLFYWRYLDEYMETLEEVFQEESADED